MIVKLEKFGASYCAPCKALDKTLDILHQEMPIQIVRYDVDENEELCEEKGIRTVPVLIYYDENGNEVTRTTGNIPISKIKEIIK